MNLTQLASELYHKAAPVAPTWEQLGDVTKSVWLDKAKLKLAGHPRWWSINQAAIAPRIRGVLQECMKMTKDIDHAKVADALLDISTAFSSLSAFFRDGAASEVGGGGSSKAGKPARGSKPAAKPASKKEEDTEELSIDTVREKLKELVEAKGKDKMVEALESVGAGKLADVDESQYQELVDKAQELIDEEDAPKKPAAKKGKAKAVTLEQLTEAAKELIAADKAAFTKLSKKYGKPSEADEDVYAEYLKAIQDAMPEEEADEEDDLL